MLISRASKPSIVCLHLCRDTIRTGYLNNTVMTHNFAWKIWTTTNFLQSHRYEWHYSDGISLRVDSFESLIYEIEILTKDLKGKKRKKKRGMDHRPTPSTGLSSQLHFWELVGQSWAAPPPTLSRSPTDLLNTTC